MEKFQIRLNSQNSNGGHKQEFTTRSIVRFYRRMKDIDPDIRAVSNPTSFTVVLLNWRVIYHFTRLRNLY